jgi:hypothetical protein
MKIFEPGKTYFGRSICDYECITEITIASRTAKTVTTDEAKTFRVSVYDGVEFIRPNGNYSMALIVRADKEPTL